MKIAIVGSGNVGGALGTRWARSGHEVWFGTRRPESDEMVQLVSAAGATARAAAISDAVAAADVVLLATPWDVTPNVVAGVGNWEGKILIDATNPLLPKLAGIEYGTTTSGAEQVATWAPGARVVKAFNTVGSNVMENPTFPDGPVVMFYCGDDAAAKATVSPLVTELGFEGVDAGPLTQARLLEPFALLWIRLAFSGHGREIAFRLLRR